MFHKLLLTNIIYHLNQYPQLNTMHSEKLVNINVSNSNTLIEPLFDYYYNLPELHQTFIFYNVLYTNYSIEYNWYNIDIFNKNYSNYIYMSKFDFYKSFYFDYIPYIYNELDNIDNIHIKHQFINFIKTYYDINNLDRFLKQVRYLLYKNK